MAETVSDVSSVELFVSDIMIPVEKKLELVVCEVAETSSVTAEVLLIAYVSVLEDIVSEIEVTELSLDCTEALVLAPSSEESSKGHHVV